MHDGHSTLLCGVTTYFFHVTIWWQPLSLLSSSLNSSHLDSSLHHVTGFKISPGNYFTLLPEHYFLCHFLKSSCWVIYRTATNTAFNLLIFFPTMISIHPRKGQYCLQSVRLLIPKDSRQSLKTKISIPFMSWDGLLAPQLQWLCTHYRSKRKKIAQKLFLNCGQKASLCAFFFKT